MFNDTRIPRMALINFKNKKLIFNQFFFVFSFQHLLKRINNIKSTQLHI